MNETASLIRTKTMRAIKSTNTTVERVVSQYLWRKNLRFRKNVKSLYGKPDIAIKKYHIVIFIDSCFWHGCEQHCRMPKTNTSYWNEKIKKNRERDKMVTQYYIDKGWNIMRIWEHDIKNNFEDTIKDIENFITSIKLSYS